MDQLMRIWRLSNLQGYVKCIIIQYVIVEISRLCDNVRIYIKYIELFALFKTFIATHNIKSL